MCGTEVGAYDCDRLLAVESSATFSLLPSVFSGECFSSSERQCEAPDVLKWMEAGVLLPLAVLAAEVVVLGDIIENDRCTDATMPVGLR